jgi:hypothetical protein
MKINEKFRLILMTAGKANDRDRVKYQSGIMDENLFISSLFTLLNKRRVEGFHLLRY